MLLETDIPVKYVSLLSSSLFQDMNLINQIQQINCRQNSLSLDFQIFFILKNKKIIAHLEFGVVIKFILLSL